MQTDFQLYKVDMKYIRNLHNIDDKVLSASPQAGSFRNNIGIALFFGPKILNLIFQKLSRRIEIGTYNTCKNRIRSQ